jgi:hypothetical protein
MTGKPTQPADPGADDHAPRPIAPRTGEGSGTALEAMLRKRKQVEHPEPADGCQQPPPA